jgi:NAD(P)-dependent dehydrogenase (short-subunit alcohol dehydrogenase family)
MADQSGPFRDKVAIVTGGASGIGRALGEALLERGASVVLADVNAAAAEVAAAELAARGAVRAAACDVTDAEAVARLVDDVAGAHGRLDFMFNNAGIALLGHARLMSLADWNGLIDVNIRGVVHGVAAAYPLMIRQGFGHIVNTASVAGLTPNPGLAGYALTKHAVVGLSTSLRIEAAQFGVKVSVVCPALIDTPIAQAARLLGADRQTVLERLPMAAYPAAACARDILAGVARDRAFILVTREARIAWWLYRMAPRVTMRLLGRFAPRHPLLAGDARAARG